MTPWVAAALAHVPVVRVAGPEDDWCGVLAETIGNDFVLLAPGEYRGPCRFVARPSDVPAELTTLQSLDPADPALFVGSDDDFVLEVSGERAILLAVTFRGLPPGIDAVRLASPREAWVRQVTFDDVAGTSIRAEGVDLNVVGSTFRGGGTAVHARCVGADCPTRVRLADNLVDGAALGLWVDAAAEATVLDDVYGAATGIRASGVLSAEGLVVDAAATGLDLEGTASVVASVIRAPVAVRAPASARVVLAGDTVLGALELRGAPVIASCAVDRLPALPDAELEGTVACAPPARCYTDAPSLDVYPPAGSPLVGAGRARPETPRDWCRAPRADPPTAGAFERSGASPGPLSLRPKRDAACVVAGGSGGPTSRGTGDTADPEPPPPVVPRGEGCACGAASSPSGWVVVAVGAAGFARRGRRRPRLDRVVGRR